MSHRIQDFLYALTESKAADLLASYNTLPEEKRNVSPGGNARTAADMLAEIAILNGETAKTLTTFSFSSNFDFAAYTFFGELVFMVWLLIKGRKTKEIS